MAASSTASGSKRIRSTTAFVVETLVLLAVLAASMAVFTQMFSRAAENANQSARVCQAVNVAKDAAEEFSCDPAAVAAGEKVGAGVAASGRDGYEVACDVTEESTETGTMYRAHIEVSDSEGVAYKLDTARYVSGVE